MPLNPGNASATSGMSKLIFENIKDQMEPIDGVEGDALEKIRASWRKLAYAVSKGVVDHLRDEMELRDLSRVSAVQTTGNTSLVDGHQHAVNIEGDITYEERDYPPGHIT